jgi:hypothetical protein
MPLTDEIRLAYQSVPAAVVTIETLQWDHVAFAGPIYVAANVEADILLPLAFGGVPVLHKAIGIEIVPGTQSQTGFSPWRLNADNVSNFLRPYIKQAAQGSQPISLTYRCYTTADLSRPGEVVPGLKLRNISLTALIVSATLTFKEVELEAFPLPTYDEEFYPELQRS